MPSARTLALVLWSVEVFESSLIVTLFTRELGKTRALAKGVRRLKSPFQGGLDLLSVSDIVLFPRASEALDLLSESAPVERFESPRRELAALYAGFHIAQLLSDLTDEHDPHPRLFDAARVTLRRLGEADLRRLRVARFELACLRELGLSPSLDSCSHCGRGLGKKGERVGFALASGGVVCDECRSSLVDVAVISRGAFEAIRALASPGDAWRRLDDQNRDLASAREIIGLVISHILGRRPRFRPLAGV